MIEKLGSRFAAPPLWTTQFFTNDDTRHKIRFGFVKPQTQEPKALVVILPGLSEFCEKYFETMHDLLDRGYASACIDWHYQGLSGRMPGFPQRRHSDGFDTDVADLDLWIKDHVIPMATKLDGTRLPVIMLAHSMGGKIGLRYLSEHAGTFNAAAFSAPYLGIHKLTKVEWLAAQILSRLPYIHDHYVPTGKDWDEAKPRPNLTSDPQRHKIHTEWGKIDEGLRLGEPTLRWVGESFKSFAKIRAAGALEKIDIPVLFGLATADKVVDNHEIRKACARIRNAALLEIDGAMHEILMESDPLRNHFLAGFDKMIKDYNIVPA